MIWVAFWGIGIAALAIITWLTLHNQDNRPPTHYDGSHKVRNRRGR